MQAFLFVVVVVPVAELAEVEPVEVELLADAVEVFPQQVFDFFVQTFFASWFSVTIADPAVETAPELFAALTAVGAAVIIGVFEVEEPSPLV